MTPHAHAVTRRAFIGATAAMIAAPAIGWSNPAPGDAHDLTFLAIGDWGDKGSIDQRQVADAMRLTARQTAPRFVISVGDNFYPHGVSSIDDPQWQESFELIYNDPALMCPWYAVLGNHDHDGNINAQMEYTKVDPRWRMPARYYSTSERLGDGSSADFFFLDTTTIVENMWGFANDDAQLAWLEQALAESRAGWKIVVGHHSVFSGGKHGSDAVLIKYVKPLFERFGVSAYLNGHDHNLQHVVVDEVHYLTCGAGAKSRPAARIDGTLFAASELGFLAASLTPAALAIAFVDATGNSLYEAAIPANP
jgi:tartrate-resistant acid phosphatase type 5